MNRRSHLHARSGGFTLVEIVIALVLMVILAGLAFPRLSGLTTRNRIDTVLNQFSADVAFARAIAVQSGEGTRIQVRTTPSGYSILTRRDGAWQESKRVDVGLEYAGFTIEPATTLSFNSRGVLTSGGVTVVVAQNQQRDSVFILPTGRVFRDY